jgi:cellulose biosynthesis protein BcsE
MDERNRSVQVRDSEGSRAPAGVRPDNLAAFARAITGVGAGAGAPAGSRLAIDALPDEVAQLATGHFYAIYAKPHTTACDALIWNTAKAAHTRHVTVVLSRPRAQIAAQMSSLGFGPGGAAPGWPRNLNVLAMPDSNGSAEGTGDARGRAPSGEPIAFARLFGGLRSLKRFGVRSNALYFVEGAERWLTWDDADALAREGRLLANWCAARRIALVLLLDPFKSGAGAAREEREDSADSDDDFLTEEPAPEAGYLEFHGACAGVARMGRTHGELLWHVDFWRAGRALVTGGTRPLRFAEGGRLSVAPDVVDSQAQATLRLARDEARVVATRAVVARETWVPPDWEIVDDLQAAVAACTGAQAPTVLLDYRDQSTLEALCAAVHTLRRECGRALKIVVVERRDALRHQYELLLLSLGVNLVIGRELPFARVQSLLRSLHGQLDTRPVAADYRAALAAALTDDVRGYLPVPAYCERIQAVLSRGAVLDLPHVLAKIALLPNVSHVDALKQCNPRRAGDVVTADASHLYVFLFACRLPDADVALRHIFAVPVDHLSDRVVCLAEASIEREVKALAEANRRSPIADYSDVFPATRARARAREPVPTGEATTVAAATADLGSPSAGEAAHRVEAVDTLLEKIDRERAATSGSTDERAQGSTAAAASAARSVVRPPGYRRSAEPWPMPLRDEGSAK